MPMAPRALETKAEFVQRLRRSWRADGGARVGLGAHHWTHGVVLEEGKLRVRRLVLERAKADAYLKEHGLFMPEHAEQLSEPTGAIVYEAASLDELIARIEAGPWPL
ncbi:MAG: hypothetical protein JNJ54_14390 [Myxococcaceae bacterium]|nr:hypothetical protein [Myxococcaceae bacterium]